jgi:hypothetical protein
VLLDTFNDAYSLIVRYVLRADILERKIDNEPQTPDFSALFSDFPL